MRSQHDFVYGSLIGKDLGSIPREMRAQIGVIEVMFVAGSGLSIVGDILSTTLTLKTSVIALAKHRATAQLLLAAGVRIPPKIRAQLKADSIRLETAEVEARELVANGLGRLNSFTLVNLCTAIEVGTEDVILTLLRFKPGLIDELLTMGVKLSTLPTDRDLTYSEARLALTRLKTWCRSGNEAPDGAIAMLKAVGIDISLDVSIRNDLREMIYLRNCILHRDHRADEKALSFAERVGVEPGRRFSVPAEAMDRYAKAAIEMTSAITRAGIAKGTFTPTQ